MGGSGAGPWGREGQNSQEEETWPAFRGCRQSVGEEQQSPHRWRDGVQAGQGGSRGTSDGGTARRRCVRLRDPAKSKQLPVRLKSDLLGIKLSLCRISVFNLPTRLWPHLFTLIKKLPHTSTHITISLAILKFITVYFFAGGR